MWWHKSGLHRLEVPDSIATRVAEFAERVWLCKIRRHHRVKMQSYGFCVRCGKRVEDT